MKPFLKEIFNKFTFIESLKQFIYELQDFTWINESELISIYNYDDFSLMKQTALFDV